uniref:Uncharacterized protein n=1 Tax=Chromera velia CCMP2878 TaxID=1169474 RepID=A0A0G4HW98_9ALVE|eukprot:Cvel_1434.t1-p1 / transcript=Cvel_1434.t1 / gene=Cvel_1434 / organism=Chromera_velia_CCMP2878 / gene_product=hypothetical protein / transcript_product=hypothetical protein / location=Cvel_scaffold50:67927-68544(-) / protein_length=206 / sequence_SO=supercontig / SO=protein_coding / is_pseudo=false
MHAIQQSGSGSQQETQMQKMTDSPPPTMEEYLERLEAFKASFCSDVQNTLQGIVLFENLLKAKQAADGSASASKSFVSRVRAMDIAHLRRMKDAGEEVLKEVHGCIEALSRNTGRFRETRPLFHAVAAEFFQKELSDFLSDKSKRGDARLLLKADTEGDALLGGQTALMQVVAANIREITANKLEAFHFENDVDSEGNEESCEIID